MPIHKVTDFLSEISAFFKKDDAHSAMYSIMDVIKWLKMTESSLFGMKSKCNNGCLSGDGVQIKCISETC